VALVGLPSISRVRLAVIYMTILFGLGYPKAWHSWGIEMLRRAKSTEIWTLHAGDTTAELSLREDQFATAVLIILYFKRHNGKPKIRVETLDTLS
jgi:hypothetical protein